MKVIFLDIDGVLNADDDFGGRSKPNPYVTANNGNVYCGISISKVRNLKYIVDKTNAKIVLVSSWKYDYIEYLKYHLNRVGKYLRNKLKRFDLEIYDTTIKYDFSHGENRGYEISQWLVDHPEVTKWVVLDDVKFDDYDFLRVTPNLVLTDPKYGLWRLPALEAVYKLTGIKDTELSNHEAWMKICTDLINCAIPDVTDLDYTVLVPETSAKIIDSEDDNDE